MDGVVADFDKVINAAFPDLNDKPEDERQRLVDSYCEANPDIFHNLEPMEDAIESVRELFNLFEVYFLSTPMWNVPHSFAGKRIWIENHFGEAAKKRLILTHRKDLNVGDYLIDDRLKNGAGEFTGTHIHFGTQWFPNWKVTLPYLKSVA